MNQFSLVGKLKGNTRKVFIRKKGSYYVCDILVTKNFRESDQSYQSEEFCVYLWQGLSQEGLSVVNFDGSVAINGRLERDENGIILIGEVVELLR